MACVCFSLPVLRNCFYSLIISLNKATQVIHSVHSSQSIEVYSNARAFLSPRYSYTESQLILDSRLHLCIQNRVGVQSLLLYSLFLWLTMFISLPSKETWQLVHDLVKILLWEYAIMHLVMIITEETFSMSTIVECYATK